MSQKNVEIVIGKLVTDEEFRGRYRIDPSTAVRELTKEKGLELTPCEWSALVGVDITQCERFANGLDPRLQKASLRAEPLATACHRPEKPVAKTEPPEEKTPGQPERRHA